MSVSEKGDRKRVSPILASLLEQTHFDSYQDFLAHYRVKVPENFNFGYDVVDEQARINPDGRAMVWLNEDGDERIFTFADIKRESDRAASFFASLGIDKGDMVMLILKRRWQFWPSIVALHKIGAVAVPATHLLTPKDIEYRCNKAGIKAIVCAGEPGIVHNIRVALPVCPTVKVLISTGPAVPEGWHNFNKGISKAEPWVRPEHVNSNEDLSLMYFTSGTSGEPKMVGHDFTYPLGHIITASYWHNIGPDSLHFTCADTGWGKAVWGKLYGQWIAGATVFTYDFEKFNAADLLQKIQDYGVTSFCAPPTIFRFMIQEDVKQYDLSKLRYCTIAGEALNPSVFEEWRALTGISLMEGFGQTETTLTIGNYPWMTPRPGSMGKPGPEYDVKIMDAEGNILGPGQEGEIVINLERRRPLGLFRKYIKAPELQARTIRDGYYHTGDVARVDEDGYFWFVGRNDDVIKSSGYRIGPFEVENALMQHPAVMECAVTGAPDPIRGQVVKATIVLAPGYKEADPAVLAKEIKDFVKHTTAPYKYPRIVEFVDALPKTISGKIRHAEIRRTTTQ